MNPRVRTLSWTLLLISIPTCLSAIVSNLDTPSKKTIECEFHDSVCAKKDENDPSCYGTRNCYDEPEAAGNLEAFCFTVWQNGSGAFTGAGAGPETGADTFKIKKQGCLFNHGSSQEQCRNRTECVEEGSVNKNHMFCCCTGNSCNRDFRWEPITIEATSPPILTPAQPSGKFYLLLYSAVPVLVLLVIGLAGAYIYKQRKSSHFSSLSQSEDGPVSPPTPTIIHRPVQLLEIKARGRFGAVWKGHLGEDQVAVKIFPLQDKQSWFAEQEIFNLPQMSHENILSFIGVDRRGENLQQEFWLVTAFHDGGSLCDFLKMNTVSLEELSRMCLGIAAGLTHLHTEIPSIRGSGVKPAIAHRDFKSKNVLIRSDLVACIGDFGLALQFKPNEIVGDTHGQVGTRRYMAPEVLEGAINFSRDAFLRIDMYACGLVLWELLSRCRDIGQVGPYKLPFEAETTPHPTLEEISDLVVHRKVRPDLKEIWRKHEALSILCETIDECWDHDAEARLSASCVLERLSLMKSILTSMNTINEDQDTTRMICQETMNNSYNNQLSQPSPSTFILQPLHSDILENSE